MTIALCLLVVCAQALGAAANVSDLWHVAGTKVVSQEVQFSNGQAHLAGTVYLPETGDHLPGVVVLHHAGLPMREAALYRHLKEGLPTLGFAVLVFDRRGSGQSSGDFKSADFETLADDAIAGQRALAKVPRIDPTRIGFWGLSQGGWLAVLAAGRNTSSAFAVAVSAPLVTANEQMQFATSNLLAVRGYSDSDVREMLDARKAWIGYLHNTNSRDVAVAALGKSESKPWFDLAYLPKASQVTTDPEHDASRKKLDDDPLAAVLKVKVPILFLYGDSDPWVPVAKSVEQLRSLSNQHPNIDYAVVVDANHEMMFPVNDKMEVDVNATRKAAPQAPTYFMILGSWLSLRVAK
ncbi:MAG: alpha/beta fold hydrolase [Candidatus Acidiferrum sp.]